MSNTATNEATVEETEFTIDCPIRLRAEYVRPRSRRERAARDLEPDRYRVTLIDCGPFWDAGKVIVRSTMYPLHSAAVALCHMGMDDAPLSLEITYRDATRATTVKGGISRIMKMRGWSPPMPSIRRLIKREEAAATAATAAESHPNPTLC